MDGPKAVFLALCLIGLTVGPAAPSAHGDTIARLNTFLPTHHADVGSVVPLGGGRVPWPARAALCPRA
ncbi:hypothetical protein [Streptomyces sp. NBC_01092]|uniref:hypothetical protein n=1 Tax=Streptomyces sp. NBC_01092 TaxID=2903748 RepID=UPI00386E2667|nr:hypothetical protein OG254_43255 [Streptomyces sp. NBC_01092]